MKRSKDEYNNYMNGYMKARWKARRRQAISHLGGICSNCGCSEFDKLDFDHKIPSTKKFTLARASSYSNKRFQEELSKCQLLCKTCHLDKTKEENGQQNKLVDILCSCGKEFKGTKNYAGHRRWCPDMG